MTALARGAFFHFGLRMKACLWCKPHSSCSSCVTFKLDDQQLPLRTAQKRWTLQPVFPACSGECAFLPRASALPMFPCLLPCVTFSVVPLNLNLVDWMQCDSVPSLDWPPFSGIFPPLVNAFWAPLTICLCPRHEMGNHRNEVFEDGKHLFKNTVLFLVWNKPWFICLQSVV